MKIVLWPDGDWQDITESPHAWKSDDFIILEVDEDQNGNPIIPDDFTPYVE